MKLTKKKGLIALVLVAAIALMSFGFAAWSTTLTIDGTVTADANWEVLITKVELTDSSGATVTGTSALQAGATTATLGNVNFDVQDGWALYTVTVENTGSVDAILTDFSLTASNTADGYAVEIGLKDADKGETLVKTNGKCEFEVLVTETSADNATEILIEDAEIAIELQYDQIAVDTAPAAPAHDHA